MASPAIHITPRKPAVAIQSIDSIIKSVIWANGMVLASLFFGLIA